MQALGEWELEEELGRGAMGVVWRARHKESGQEAALKLAGEPYADDPDARSRFEREVAALTQLRHPSLVRALDAGRDGSGRPWLAQELVEGETLRARLSRGPLAPEAAARLGARLARGLAVAHEAGIVHRDVKPENVMLRQDGEPVLLDFGLARTLGRATQLTRTGEILGTPAYMAPEQVSGSPRGVGPPADVYALGATLYAALCGEPPFTQASAILCMEAVLKHPAPSLRTRAPGVDPDLAAICERCLAKQPEARWPDAAALAAALEGWLAGVAGGPRVPRALLAAAGLSVLAAAGALALRGGKGPPDPPRPVPAAPASRTVAPPVPPLTPVPAPTPVLRELPPPTVHEVHEGPVLLAAHPDGGGFVSVGRDARQRAALWDGLRQLEVVYLTGTPASLAATASAWWTGGPGKLERHSWSGQEVETLLLDDPDFTPVRLAISPDETLAVAVGDRADPMEVSLFELTPQPRRRWSADLEGKLIQAAITFAPGGRVLVARAPRQMLFVPGDPGGWLRVLSVEDGTTLETDRRQMPLSFDTDRRGRVLLGTAAGALFLFGGTLRDGELTNIRGPDEAARVVDQPIGGCGFAGPDHVVVLIADDDAKNRQVEVWNLPSGQRLSRQRLGSIQPWGFACDPHGRWLAVGTQQGQVLTWDLEGVLRR